jgi:hypothetical protein
MPSAVIRAIHYDEASRKLRVIFQSGRHYTYHDVPEETYREMRAAFSKGEFFNEHIRDRFRFTRDT